jgi:tetratricopeptide (TPR) repeat protein
MNNKYGEAVKHMALADVLLELGEVEAAAELAERGLETVRAPATLVPAALVHISAGDQDAALDIAASLAEQLSPQSRAYAEMITALVFLESGDHLAAINQLTAAIDTADLWLLRIYRGRAYLEGGYYVEALDDFTVAQDRHGEATALFLDDLPTYRYMSTLPYWIARAQTELGMTHDARQNFTLFTARRPVGGAMADDARYRMK